MDRVIQQLPEVLVTLLQHLHWTLSQLIILLPHTFGLVHLRSSWTCCNFQILSQLALPSLTAVSTFSVTL